jgi:hypothetical protein
MGAYAFISYKHGDPSTKLAELLEQQLEGYADALGYEWFFDANIKTGEEWAAEVRGALAKTTHFFALLDMPYWLSRECRKELYAAVARYEQDRSCRLLFVKAQEIRPEYLTFDKARERGDLISPEPGVDKLGRIADVQFLGPFDDNRRLVSLQWDKPFILQQQIAQLMNRFIETLRE